jgi:hypothetical protein
VVDDDGRVVMLLCCSLGWLWFYNAMAHNNILLWAVAHPHPHVSNPSIIIDRRTSGRTPNKTGVGVIVPSRPYLWGCGRGTATERYT